MNQRREPRRLSADVYILHRLVWHRNIRQGYIVNQSSMMCPLPSLCVSFQIEKKMLDQSNSTSTNSPNITESATGMSTLVAIEQYMSIYGPLVLATLGIIGNVLSILCLLYTSDAADE